MANDIEGLSCARWLFKCLAWRNVYSDPLPILEIGLLLSLLLSFWK